MPANPDNSTTTAAAISWRRWLLTVATGPACFAILHIGAAYPDWTEACYSRSLYPWLQRGLVAVARLSPWSLGELLLLSLLATALAGLLRLLWRGCRQPRLLPALLLRALLSLSAFASMLLALFFLLWGWNHARQPLALHLGVTTAAVDPAALGRVAERLAADCNRLRPAALDPLLWPAAWQQMVTEAYDLAARELPSLGGPPPPLRQAWLSPLLTWSSITGVYSPFTGEPHINSEPPAILMLAIACHEVAHLRGYAREDEANFLAYHVANQSPQAILRYSGSLFALRELLQQLWMVDNQLLGRVQEALTPAVQADIAVIDAFWARRPPTITKVMTAVAQSSNDSYLKAAGQQQGVRSYGRMVDLLVAVLDH